MAILDRPLAFNVDDAARHIGIDRTALENLIAKDEIPVRVIENQIVIRRLDLAAFLDSVETGSFKGQVPRELLARSEKI